MGRQQPIRSRGGEQINESCDRHHCANRKRALRLAVRSLAIFREKKSRDERKLTGDLSVRDYGTCILLRQLLMRTFLSYHSI